MTNHNAKANTIGFHHAGIVVPDLDAAVHFYCELFGFVRLSAGQWQRDNRPFNQMIGLTESAARFAMLKGGNAYLELFEYSEPPALDLRDNVGANEPGIRHLAFAVEDVTAALSQCEALGGSKINDPETIAGGATSVYCRDPFGNLLELVAPAGRFPAPFLPT